MAGDKKLTELTQVNLTELTDLMYIVTYDGEETQQSRSISAQTFLASQVSGNNRIIKGRVVWTGSGYIHESVEMTYEINKQIYYSDGVQVTNDAPDATHPRFDVIYADANGLGIKKGTPAASPTVPGLDSPKYQVATNIVLVTNGTTTPSRLNLDTIFNEVGTEVGGEWDTSENTSTARITLLSTSPTPLDLTKDIYTPDSLEEGDRITFEHSTPILISELQDIRMLFKPLFTWKNSYISVELYDNTTLVGTAIIDRNKVNSKLTTTVQSVYLFDSDFDFVDGETQFDEVRFEAYGTFLQFQLDKIEVQYGTDENTSSKPWSGKASDVTTDTDGFTGNLSSAEDDVQKALDLIDGLTIGGGDMVLSGTQTVTGAKTFNDAKLLLRNVANTFSSYFTNTNTAARIYTLPNKAITIAGLVDITNRAQFLEVAFSDETTAIDAGTGKVTFTMPNYATTLTGVSCSFVTAPTTSAITVDINEGGTSVLSTKITVDATEFTSETAATPPVISDSSLAANAIMSVDVDTADTGGTSAGGKIILYFNKA